MIAAEPPAAPPAPACRWYRPTPDRLVVGLLAAEGLLWLSERFRWFAFNEIKNLTVLVTLAVVVAWLVFLVVWFLVSRVFRRRFQFSIRALLALMVAVALPMSWLAVCIRETQRQQRVVDRIYELDGVVNLDALEIEPKLSNFHVPARTLSQWLGEDFFLTANGADFDQRVDGLKDVKELPHIAVVTFQSVRLRDEDFRQLQAVRELRELGFITTQFPAAGFDCLQDLDQLESLTFLECPVDDAVLAHIGRLTRLRHLSIDSNKVTDASLRHLSSLRQLETLDLPHARISGEGMKYLKDMRRLRMLNLHSTPLTDHGLWYLKVHASLRELMLDHTRITGEGLQYIQGMQQLEKLSVSSEEVIGDEAVPYLTKLKHLRSLSFGTGTALSQSGFEELKKALPDCDILTTSPTVPWPPTDEPLWSRELLTRPAKDKKTGDASP